MRRVTLWVAGAVHSATVAVPLGTTLEYKFTLGGWEREGLGPSGTADHNEASWRARVGDQLAWLLRPR